MAKPFFINQECSFLCDINKLDFSLISIQMYLTLCNSYSRLNFNSITKLWFSPFMYIVGSFSYLLYIHMLHTGNCWCGVVCTVHMFHNHWCRVWGMTASTLLLWYCCNFQTCFRRKWGMRENTLQRIQKIARFHV